MYTTFDKIQHQFILKTCWANNRSLSTVILIGEALKNSLQMRPLPVLLVRLSARPVTQEKS